MIKIENLIKDYGKVRALDNLSLEVARGEIFGLLGPNGAGKSTTVKILNTLVKPTSGRAFLDGFDVQKDPLAIKQRIGVVPQENNLDRDLTAFENMRIYGLLHRVPDLFLKIEENLKSMDLWDRRNDLVLTFSGGMQRRLLIARAELGDPKVLFLDEPTIGLDPQIRREIWNRIRRIRKQGGTVLLTTHYIEEAEALSDRVGILTRGRLVALDTTANLKKMVGEYVVEYVGKDGGKVYQMCRSREDAQCHLEAAENNMVFRKSNLEDVFVHLTGEKIEA
ncbi:MAG TPA: ATP-binding cassette domain-containing protein [Thermodesulfobacteriota bacterium]|nr:ATP-binding cassette domain-containing protein [Thermodesulfobacteriota bacterium]